ncbi:cytochrome P450 [Microdochium trichocladiopsis]|uniref:Cytochrome P450 n=1 Tax=Microdochium trichocladiopsis TaxID=1682393 RepID=A0A9P9BHB8_9PEZI|nr:cytochrome P450 [Microdochium trichocladiopsis]KAH7018329.1 cytochrome P450 [Microdochium trichocladiopsis]
MASIAFYLLGEDASSTTEIEVSRTSHFEDVQHLMASHFSIVDPKGVGFTQDGHSLTSVAEIVAATSPVAIAIDGKPVRAVPGPKGLPYVGNYFEIYPDHLGNHQRLFDQYGPLFKTNNMGSQIFHTNDPTLANIFFSETDFFTKLIVPGHPLHPIKLQAAGVFLGDTDTDEWRAAHKFLPPALGPKAVRHYAPTMQQTVESSFAVFDELDARGEAWNVYAYMLKMGSQAVGKLVLGMDFQHFSAVDAPPHEMVIKIAMGLELNKRVSAWGPWYASLPFGVPKLLRTTSARIEELLMESIKAASQGGIEDLELQEAALKADNLVDYCLRATDSKGNKLPPKQFAEALVVATGAGFTTTSSLLSWLIYGLVQYPGMQDRLVQELVDNGFADDTQVTPELISKLSFMEAYVKETQRKHNPSYQPARTAKTDMVLPGGYKLPAGSIVIPALHHIHNNAALWDNPARFDPDRWLAKDAATGEAKQPAPQGTYMPFATGPRSCIGFNFALQEVKIFLPKLVWRYRFTLASPTDGKVEYDPYFQLIRPNNLYVRAERRGKWPPKSE